MILPPIFAGIFMLSLGHNLFPRFFFFAMGFGLLIVIHGAMELPKFLSDLISKLNKTENRNPQSAIRNPIGVGLVSLIILASITTLPRNYMLPKQNFSGARDFVESQRRPNDEIVAVSIAGMMYRKLFAPNWTAAETGNDLEKIHQKNEKIWLIYTLSPEIKAFHPDMWQIIEQKYEIVKIFPGTLNGGEIFVCRKRTAKEENNESNRNLGKIENNPLQASQKP
jgi:hypothetical protein